MKLKTYLPILLLIFLHSNLLQAQDQKAKNILDELSKKTKSYNTMKAEFEYRMFSESDGIDEVQQGSLISKGNKYHLNIAGQEIISDGKTVWTVLSDAEEVQVNNVPEETEEADFVSPNSILTLWEKGFKYQFEASGKLDGRSVEIIKLFPIKSDEKSFHTIRLFVREDKSAIEKIEIKGKDGTDYIYTIKKFESNPTVADKTFTFSVKEHPNFDVIDLR